MQETSKFKKIISRKAKGHVKLHRGMDIPRIDNYCIDNRCVDISHIDNYLFDTLNSTFTAFTLKVRKICLSAIL